MSERRRESGAVPEIGSESLLDNATEVRVDRIWERLEGDLFLPEPLPRLRGWLVPVGGMALFVLGFAFGTQNADIPAPVTATLSAEPAASLPALAVPQNSALAPRRPNKLRSPVVAPPAQVAEPIAVNRIDEEAAPEPVSVETPAIWQELADRGNYEGALQSLEQSSRFENAVSMASPEQLMLLVDVARAVGQHSRGVLALRRIVSEHSADPNAPLAAWMLGNMLDKSGDRDGAAKAFAAYRTLSPSGDFAEDAMAREIEVAIEQGDFGRARAMADRYASQFSTSDRLARIRAQLALVTAADAGTTQAPARTETLTPTDTPAPPGARTSGVTGPTRATQPTGGPQDATEDSQ